MRDLVFGVPAALPGIVTGMRFAMAGLMLDACLRGLLLVDPSRRSRGARPGPSRP